MERTAEQRRRQAAWSMKERRTLRGYLRDIFKHARQRVLKGRSRAKRITFSKDELFDFAINHSSYPRLHAEWVASGYQPRLSPSIDRIDSRGDYTLDNIQFITKHQNSIKGVGNRTVATVERHRSIDMTTIYEITPIQTIRAGTPLIFDTSEAVIRTNYPTHFS